MLHTKPSPPRFRNEDLGHMSERKEPSRKWCFEYPGRRRINKQKYKGKAKCHFEYKRGGKGSILNPHFCFCPLRVALAPFAWSTNSTCTRAVHAVAWQNHHFILNVTSPVTWSGRHSSVWGSFKFILCSWNCRTENVYYLVHLQWANEDNAMHKSDYDTNLVVFGCWDFPTTRFHDSAILLYCKE
jgi:hypothetical protein